jgi:hypothetical protein
MSLGCDAGGIAGRGVLLDYVSWYEAKHGKPAPPPYTSNVITIAELEESKYSSPRHYYDFRY